MPRTSTDDGVALELWGQHDGDNQQFRFEAAGSNTYRIISRVSGHPVCVANAANRPGTAIQQLRRADGDNGKYKLIDAGQGRVQVVALIGNRPLTASGQDLVLGDQPNASTQFQLVALGAYKPDGGRPAPEKLVTPDPNRWYAIKHIQNNTVFDVPRPSKDSGLSLELWGYHGGDNQQIRFEPGPESHHQPSRTGADENLEIQRDVSLATAQVVGRERKI